MKQVGSDSTKNLGLRYVMSHRQYRQDLSTDGE